MLRFGIFKSESVKDEFRYSAYEQYSSFAVDKMIQYFNFLVKTNYNI